MIIDFHTHSFPDKIAARVADSLSHLSHSIYYICPDLSSLKKSMQTAGIDYSVNLPVVTRKDQTVSVNDRMISSYCDSLEMGIINFGGMHPDYEDFSHEITRLAQNGIKGIKLHPAYQNVFLNDIRFKRIIGKASEEGLIVLIHAGEDIGYPDQNFASPGMIEEIIKDVQPEKFVLAHFGGWQGWKDFEKYLAGAPVYLDTAFSFGPITPVEEERDLLSHGYNLSSGEFVRLSRLHGTGKVLFATDSPWASQSEYVDFVQDSDLTQEEKQQILYKNARNLLGL